MDSKFSIVIPLFNKETSIAKTLISCVLQSYLSFEIIIIDDGSTDNSVAICHDTLAKTNRTFSVVRQCNAGVAAARNTGIRAAKGDYIVFLDADDLLEEQHLDNLTKLIDSSDNGKVFSVGHTILLNSKKMIPATHFKPNFSGKVKEPFVSFSKGLSLMNSSTSCVKRCILRGDLLFPEGETRGEDLFLWIMLLSRYELYHTASPSVIINRDADNRSADLALQTIPCHFSLLAKILSGNKPRFLIQKGMRRFFVISAAKTIIYYQLRGDRNILGKILKLCRENRLFGPFVLISSLSLIPVKLFSLILILKNR